MRLELVMKSIVMVVMAGVLGIYDLIIVVVISTRINPKAKSYCLFDGYAHLSFGLTYGLASLSTGMAIGIVGDAGVRLYGKIVNLFRGLTKDMTCLVDVDGDFAPIVELVKVRKKYGFLLVLDDHIHKVTHLSNSKIEEELKAKMPSLDKKYAMVLEEGDARNELKSRGMLKVGKRKKVQFLRNDETKKLLKKQEDDVAVIHTNGTAAHIHKVTHLSNSKIEKELKAKMPSLDKKYAMELEEGGAGMSLRVKGCSSGVRGRKFNS
ncbi:hypothetical protein Patl1_15362 [Pistacia atlantica]|uniref:Uncharacterized protein n=1 Tax=Pistacia atlantica TaxID=434234 RepID=A0ACC1BAV5_9ROSI|nr:hypothetical protein Patl1_15362 [Pistacia atlantica]